MQRSEDTSRSAPRRQPSRLFDRSKSPPAASPIPGSLQAKFGISAGGFQVNF